MNEHADCPRDQNSWELRCRFVVALLWILGIGVMERPATIAVAGVILFVMLVCSTVCIKKVFRNFLMIFPFLLVSFATLSISDGFPITYEAVDFALLISLRMTASILAVGLVARNRVAEYLAAFQALRFPDSLTSTLFLTQRYVYAIGRQFSATRNTLVSRLFSPRLRMKTFKIYGQIVGGLTIHAIDRSEHVRKAMASRGFQGRMRTAPASPIRLSDILKSVFAVAILIFLLFVEWYFVVEN